MCAEAWLSVIDHTEQPCAIRAYRTNSLRLGDRHLLDWSANRAVCRPFRTPTDVLSRHVIQSGKRQATAMWLQKILRGESGRRKPAIWSKVFSTRNKPRQALIVADSTG